MPNRDRDDHDSLVERFLNWKSVVLFWLAFALLPCLLNLLYSEFSTWAVPFHYIVKTEALTSAIWILATPLVFWLARRFPISGTDWLPNLVILLVAGLIIPLAWANTFLVLYRPLISREEVEFVDHLVIYLEYHLYALILIFWFLVLTYHVLAYVDRYREGERTTRRIRESLASSRLEVLKAQMQPHFLFNTLHTIGSLIRLDKKEPALETISDLGELLRFSLQAAGHNYSTLNHELLFIKKYLSIESQRFRDRLTVEYRIDLDAEDALVPALLLQPLVENAVKHGICRVRDAGRLVIVARRDSNRLHIEIHDDGPGIDAVFRENETTGFGIKNTRERLQRLYGGMFSFELKNGPVRGAIATVTIPFRTSSSGEQTK